MTLGSNKLGSVKLLHELFSASAARSPEAVAVVLGDQQLTYGELDRRSNQLARHLQKLGIGPEKVVGIYLPHSLDMIIAVWGILKAGGAYLPLDVRAPGSRIAAVLAAARARAVVLNASETLTAVPNDLAQVTLAAAAEASDKPVESPVDESNLALVVFTSGSTGEPKGILLEHRNLTHIYLAWEEAYDLGREVRNHCQIASFSFAVFQGDVIRAHGSGGKLALCPMEVVADPAALHRVLAEERVHYVELVPTVLRPLLRHLEEEGAGLEELRYLVVGSDRWYLREHRRLEKLCGEETQAVHAFGTTETSIDIARFLGSQLGDLEPHGLTPIGKAFLGVEAHIVGAGLTPVEEGESGQLVVGGGGVSRGYLRNPRLTAEKMIPDPFAAETGARLFATGDAARRLTDGNIEFLGRGDSQVKIRGFRIELGEIEAALEKHEAIEECVLVSREDEKGEARLVAYLVPKDKERLQALARSS